MLEKAFKRIHAYPVEKRKALQSYTITYHWHTVSSGETALKNVARKQGTFKPFLVIIGSSRGDIRYYEDFMKLINDPNSPTVYSLILRKYRIVVVIVVLLVEAGMISIKPNTQLFSKGDLSRHSGNEEYITIADMVTGPCQERIQEIGKLFDEKLPEGNIYSVLSQLLAEHMKFSFFHLYSYRSAQLSLRDFVNTMTVHMLVESEEVPDLSIPESYSQMSSPLNSDEWSVSGAASLATTEFSRLCSGRNEYLKSNPNPPRKSDHAITIPQICGIFNATDVPTNVNLLTNGTATARHNAQEVGAAVAAAAANIDAAELEEDGSDQSEGESDGGDVGDNYIFMDYPPEDVDVPEEVLAQAPAQPGNEPLAGPSQRPNPVGFTYGRPTAVRPTAVRPISCPPNPVRRAAVRPTAVRPTAVRPTSGPPNAEGERANAGAPVTESTEPENDLSGAPTARKRNANETDIGPQGSSTPKRHRDAALDDSDLEIVLVAHLERPDANAAESERRNERQRSTFAGPQTGARGEGGAPHVRTTASEVPQQRVHRTGGGGLPPVQGRIAQETRETSARGSENAIATGDGDAGAIPRPVGSTGQLGSEPPAAPENAGDDNAGAIPRPVASNSNDGQAKGGEEAQAEEEIGQKASGYGKYVGIICVLVAVFYLLVCNLGTDLKDFQRSNIIARLSAVPEPPTINCDIPLEAATVSCREEECVNKVFKYCAKKNFSEKKGLYPKRRFTLKKEEDEIIAKYM